MAIIATCLIGTLFYINEPVVNMRESPTIQSKVVSQVILSEQIQLQKEIEDWALVVSSDDYSGWIQADSFVKLKNPYQVSLTVSRLAAHIYAVPDTEYGPIKTVPYGTQLEQLEVMDARWIKISLPNSQEYYIQKGDVSPEQQLKSKGDLVSFSPRFLGLPYTWGGRSSFGFDCSGFVQMLYNKIGIDLPRDSKQQILDPRFQTITLEALEPGDLIFFGKADKNIFHVGMYLRNGQFIHATARENQPWIRVSHLSDFEWSGHPQAYYPHRLARQIIK